MIQYQVTPYQSSRNRIKIEATFPCDAEETELFMCAWRPGRYEEGNFTRLVSHLNVFDDRSQKRKVEKTGKNSWKTVTSGTKFITVSYLYTGNAFNAGNTYFDEKILLINPVNSLIYSDINYSAGIALCIHNPRKNYGFSSKKTSQLIVEDYDQLFDQPVLNATDVETLHYEVNGIPFYLDIWGMPPLPEERLLSDFKAFTQQQIQDFGEFPAKEFHFLLLGTPQYYLHGVEHLNSTVIVLGPNTEFTEAFYFRLLSVASHELYHVWNIKSLRPKELLPYRYQSLNYSRMGYIYEGVTTYLGDLYLLRSGVISADKYLNVLEEYIQKHIDNPGRFSCSVADSSVDTWVDGYVPGTPGRKVSIYNEGALIAFMIDVQLRVSTRNKVCLETFMKQLYHQFGKQGPGYTQQNVLTLLFDLSAFDFTAFFERYVDHANGYEVGISNALEALALEMHLCKAKSAFIRSTGIRTLELQGECTVHSLAEGSPGEMAGICEGDALIGFNDQPFTRAVAEAFFDQEEVNEANITLRRNYREMVLTLPIVQRTFYPHVQLRKANTDDKQKLKNQELFGI